MGRDPDRMCSMVQTPYAIVMIELPRRMTGEEIVRHVKHVVESSDRGWFIDEAGYRDGDIHTIGRNSMFVVEQNAVVPGDNSELFFRSEWHYSSIQVLDERTDAAIWNIEVSSKDIVEATKSFAEELSAYFKEQCV